MPRGLERAQASGIPTAVIESKPFGKDRAGVRGGAAAALDEHRIELICLGGFMRLFTAEFVQRWYGKMLNIHPSLLPSFPGLDPHGQALARRREDLGRDGAFRDSGNRCRADRDAGRGRGVPMTTRRRRCRERILGIEHRIYPEALRLLASGKVRLEGDICKSPTAPRATAP